MGISPDSPLGGYCTLSPSPIPRDLLDPLEETVNSPASQAGDCGFKSRTGHGTSNPLLARYSATTTGHYGVWASGRSPGLGPGHREFDSPLPDVTVGSSGPSPSRRRCVSPAVRYRPSKRPGEVCTPPLALSFHLGPDVGRCDCYIASPRPTGPLARISAFQAGERGSIPRWGTSEGDALGEHPVWNTGQGHTWGFDSSTLRLESVPECALGVALHGGECS